MAHVIVTSALFVLLVAGTGGAMIFRPTKNRFIRSALFGLMLLTPLICYSIFMLSLEVHRPTDRAYFWLGLMMSSPLYLGWIFLCVIVNRMGNQRREKA